MVGDVKFHDTATHLLELGSLGVHHHSGFTWCGAGSGSAFLAIDLYKTEPARTKCFEAIGGTEFRNCGAEKCGGSHNRSASRDSSRHTVNNELYLNIALDSGSS
jgi:hypothetical protein